MLRYGYTLEQVDRLAGLCATVAGSRAGNAATFSDPRDEARFAITEHLYVAEQPPTEEDLRRVGMRAVSQAAYLDLRWRGRKFVQGGGVGPMVGHWKYWLDHGADVRSFEERIVEQIAVRQVLARLTPSARRVLLAFAAHGYSYPDTARALGIRKETMAASLANARDQFRSLWHEHETPQQWQWRVQRRRMPDERLSPCGTRAAFERHRKRGELACEVCTRARAQDRIRERERVLALAAAGYGAALGERVRQLRTARGMYPAALAKAARVSKTTILRLEQGRVVAPKPATVTLIDEALDAGGELVAMLPMVADGDAETRPPERRGRRARRSGRTTGRGQAASRRRQPRTARDLLPCGTTAAFERHRKRGEPACQACIRARAQERVRQRERVLVQAAAGYGAALGERVRQLRTAKGMYLVALGEEAGVSKTAILRLELGRVVAPKPTVVKLIDQALDAGGELVTMLDGWRRTGDASGCAGRLAVRVERTAGYEPRLESADR